MSDNTVRYQYFSLAYVCRNMTIPVGLGLHAWTQAVEDYIKKNVNEWITEHNRKNYLSFSTKYTGYVIDGGYIYFTREETLKETKDRIAKEQKLFRMQEAARKETLRKNYARLLDLTALFTDPAVVEEAAELHRLYQERHKPKTTKEPNKGTPKDTAGCDCGDAYCDVCSDL